MTRTADIYLTPRELDARADALTRDADKMPPSHAKDQAMKAVLQDRRMADMKRMIGDPEERLPGL